MLNEEVGKDFHARSRSGDRDRTGRGAARVLIADPVIGSRLLLADAISQSGFLVTTASTTADARIAIERGDILLALVDENFAGESGGLDFLVELRTLYPDVSRALVTNKGDLALMGKIVERADVSFLLSKPWDVSALRQTLRNVLLGEREYKGWDQISLRSNGALSRRIATRSRRLSTSLRKRRDSRHEMILRGILAGLNSVEFEAQLFEMVDDELAEAFGIQRWLYVDTQSGAVARICGQREFEEGEADAPPSREEQALLLETQSRDGVHRLSAPLSRSEAGLIRIGFVLEEVGRRALTCLVWCDAACGEALIEMIRDLRHGVNLTIRRIHDAERRASDARELADRVSRELKTPVGALTQAVDLVRGEAIRAGMSTEWVDRVLSESQRVVRAVDHLEGEMVSDRPSLPLTSS